MLLGPSGSNKSTLLNILGGLDRPTAGRALFRDLDLGGADDAAITQYRRRHVGFVFQFYNLIASLTAEENVELVTEVADDLMPAPDALALVGLEHRLAHFRRSSRAASSSASRSRARSPSARRCC